MKLNCVVVDDSSIQRLIITKLVNNNQNLNLIGDFSNAIEAYGDYVKVVTEEESNLVLSTMKAFENELTKEKFVRVHKSFIVNIDKISRFNSKFVEIGANKIPLSRNKKDVLIKAIS